MYSLVCIVLAYCSCVRRNDDSGTVSGTGFMNSSGIPVSSSAPRHRTCAGAYSFIKASISIMSAQGRPFQLARSVGSYVGSEAKTRHTALHALSLLQVTRSD